MSRRRPLYTSKGDANPDHEALIDFIEQRIRTRSEKLKGWTMNAIAAVGTVALLAVALLAIARTLGLL